MIRTCIILGATLCLLGGVADAQQDGSDVELYDYVVQDGDTCAGISRREFGDPKAYRLIHRHNKLGPVPHRFKKGGILRLPRATRKPDATLGSHRGQVQYRRATEATWDATTLGMDLYRAWRVWSQERSTAVVVFRDQSVVSMRDNTVLVIYGPNSARVRSKRAVRARLESGALRTRLAALEGRLVLETESSTMDMGPGSAVVSADATLGRATVSNHEGEGVAVRAAKKRRGARPVRVRAGQGTWVKKGQAPAPARDLPPAPLFDAVPRLALGFGHTGVTLRGTWASVPQAASYRIEIATDPNVRIVVAAFQVNKSITSFEARGLKAGVYYLSVASIDDEGLESSPSKRRVAEALALELIQPSGEPATQRAPTSGNEAEVPLAVGSVVVVPDEFSCALGTQPMGARLNLLQGGKTQLRCQDANGATSTPLALDVHAPVATPKSATEARTIARETPVVAQVELTSPVFVGAEYRVLAPLGVDASIRGTTGPTSVLMIDLVAGPSAPQQFRIKIVRDTAAGTIVMASLAVGVREETAIAVGETSTIAETSSSLRFSLLLGSMFTPLEDESKEPNMMPFVGGRASWQFARFWAWESESVLARRLGDDQSWVASNQLLLGLRIPLSSAVLVRARAGVAQWIDGGAPVASTLSHGAVVSAGLEHQWGKRSLRFDLSSYAGADADSRLGLSMSLQFDP